MGVTGVTLDVAIGEVAEGIGVVANGSLMRFKSGTSKLGPPGAEAAGKVGATTVVVAAGGTVEESPMTGIARPGIPGDIDSIFFSGDD